MKTGRLKVSFSFSITISQVANSSPALMDSIKADHGYNLDSKSVRNLLTIMSTLTMQERRDFLQFVTGSPKLPIGGWYSTYCLHLTNN